MTSLHVQVRLGMTREARWTTMSSWLQRDASRADRNGARVLTLYSPPPDHYGGLRHAVIVPTTKYQRLERRIRHAARAKRSVLVTGPAGTGKTNAVRYVLRDQPFAEVTFSDAPNRRETLDAIHEGLLGEPGQGSAASIERALRRAIRVEPFFLVVDEVESLSAQRISLLRKLEDIAGSQLTLVLIGDTEAVATIRSDARLFGRVRGHIGFEPMNYRAAAKYLPAYHPAYRNVSDLRLRQLHAEQMHGNWRAIARFTDVIEATAEDHGCELDGCLNDDQFVALVIDDFWNPD
jgi:hypothetical protein